GSVNVVRRHAAGRVNVVRRHAAGRVNVVAAAARRGAAVPVPARPRRPVRPHRPGAHPLLPPEQAARRSAPDLARARRRRVRGAPPDSHDEAGPERGGLLVRVHAEEPQVRQGGAAEPEHGRHGPLEVGGQEHAGHLREGEGDDRVQELAGVRGVRLRRRRRLQEEADREDGVEDDGVRGRGLQQARLVRLQLHAAQRLGAVQDNAQAGEEERGGGGSRRFSGDEVVEEEEHEPSSMMLADEPLTDTSPDTSQQAQVTAPAGLLGNGANWSDSTADSQAGRSGSGSDPQRLPTTTRSSLLIWGPCRVGTVVTMSSRLIHGPGTCIIQRAPILIRPAAGFRTPSDPDPMEIPSEPPAYHPQPRHVVTDLPSSSSGGLDELTKVIRKRKEHARASGDDAGKKGNAAVKKSSGRAKPDGQN
ncbi:hypothetical protein CFC21_048471, partial [Triticum aestivum]